MVFCCFSRTSRPIVHNTDPEWKVLWLDSSKSTTLTTLREDHANLLKNVSVTFHLEEFIRALKGNAYREGSHWRRRSPTRFDLAIVLNWGIEADKINSKAAEIFNLIDTRACSTAIWLSKETERPLHPDLREKPAHVIHDPLDRSFIFALQLHKKGELLSPTVTRSAESDETFVHNFITLTPTSITSKAKGPESYSLRDEALEKVEAEQEDAPFSANQNIQYVSPRERFTSTKNIESNRSMQTQSPSFVPDSRRTPKPLRRSSFDSPEHAPSSPEDEVIFVTNPKRLEATTTTSTTLIPTRELPPRISIPDRHMEGAAPTHKLKKVASKNVFTPNFLLLEDTFIIGTVASLHISAYGNVFWVNHTDQALNALCHRSFQCYNPLTRKHNLESSPIEFDAAFIDFHIDMDTRHGRELVQEFRAFETSQRVRGLVLKSPLIYTFTTDYCDPSRSLSETDGRLFDGICPKPISAGLAQTIMSSLGYPKRPVPQRNSSPSAVVMTISTPTTTNIPLPGTPLPDGV